MSGHHPWTAIRHKSTPAAVAAARREFERCYDPPWWRLVRAVDRIRAQVERASG